MNNPTVTIDKAATPVDGKTVASLVLGIVGLILVWVMPLVALPVTVVGLVLGVKGRTSAAREMATAGLVLSILGLVLAVGLVALHLLMLYGLGNYTITTTVQ